MDTSFPTEEHARVSYMAETRAIGDQITELAGHINAGTYRLLTLMPSSTAAAVGHAELRNPSRTG